ncbi:enoyl-CoA hydratase/isomerase family protein [Thermocatellispora tengchongensis]|uniref:enoyl-CoA hydratase/isomerase family protein n=1 Tax=Thermocatellispora tengchongensis TaxID=1073253 RepID=UPI00362E03B1
MGFVEFERDGEVGVIVLNRPERMNALGSAMLGELRAAYRELEGDPGLKAGIVTGRGRAFCAGRDIKRAPPATPASATRPRPSTPTSS